MGGSLVRRTLLDHCMWLACTQLGLQAFYLDRVCWDIFCGFWSRLHNISAEYSSICPRFIIWGAPIMARHSRIVNSLAWFEVWALRAGRHMNHARWATTEVFGATLAILNLHDLLVRLLIYLLCHSCFLCESCCCFLLICAMESNSRIDVPKLSTKEVNLTYFKF